MSHFQELVSLRPVRPPSADAHVVASWNLSENAVSDPTYEANYRAGLRLSGPVPLEGSSYGTASTQLPRDMTSNDQDPWMDLGEVTWESAPSRG